MSDPHALVVHTAEEAAVILRGTASWLEEQARLRRIPFTMIGGSYRFTDAHLIQILKLFEEQPTGASSSHAPRRRADPALPEGVTALKARRPKRSRAASA